MILISQGVHRRHNAAADGDVQLQFGEITGGRLVEGYGLTEGRAGHALQRTGERRARRFDWSAAAGCRSEDRGLRLRTSPWARKASCGAARK